MKLNHLLIFVMAGLMFGACADPDLSPIITFDKAGKGGYARLVELKTGEYDLDNFSSSALEYDIEFIDLEGGDLITNYRITVAYVDNTPDNGDDQSTDFIEVASYGPGDFGTSVNGNKGMSISLKATDMAAATGVSFDNMGAGDQFSFKTFVTVTDESANGSTVYGAANSTSAVNGSAFQGYFDFPAKLTCPLQESEFVGTYSVTYGAGAVAGAFGWTFGETPGDVELSLVPGSSTRRQASFPYLPDDFGFGPYTMDIDFVCDQLVVRSIDTGVGCGGGSIIIAQGDITPFDRGNQSELVINLVDYSRDGGCGVDALPITIILTKN